MSRDVKITYYCDICGAKTLTPQEQPFIIKIIKEGVTGVFKSWENVCMGCKNKVQTFIEEVPKERL